MAVSKVATASGTTDPAHTPSAGSDRCAYIGIMSADSVNGLYNATALTYGGQTCVAVDSAQVSRQGCGMSVWRLNEAGIAAMSGNAITPTWGDTDGLPEVIGYFVTEWAGVHQTTFNGTPVKGTNDVTGTTFDAGDVNGVADGYIAGFSVFGSGNPTHTFDALDNDQFVDGAAGETGRQGSLVTTDTSAKDLATTYGASSRPMVVIGFVINPAAAAGGLPDFHGANRGILRGVGRGVG